jgi:pilus assembly protein Flp/PilA
MTAIQKFLRDEDGVTAIEYALIAALIAVAIVTATTQLGTKIGTTFDDIKAKL